MIFSCIPKWTWFINFWDYDLDQVHNALLENPMLLKNRDYLKVG